MARADYPAGRETQFKLSGKNSAANCIPLLKPLNDFRFRCCGLFRGKNVTRERERERERERASALRTPERCPFVGSARLAAKGRRR